MIVPKFFQQLIGTKGLLKKEACISLSIICYLSAPISALLYVKAFSVSCFEASYPFDLHRVQGIKLLGIFEKSDVPTPPGRTAATPIVIAQTLRKGSTLKADCYKRSGLVKMLAHKGCPG